MWNWLCAGWGFFTKKQTQYDAFSRSHTDWWRGFQTHSRTACRDEIEALEHIRDQWRR